MKVCAFFLGIALLNDELPDPLASDPECVKVKDWRHKLQKAFLGESMPAEPASLGFVEEEETDLTVSVGNVPLERSV